MESTSKVALTIFSFMVGSLRITLSHKDHKQMHQEEGKQERPSTASAFDWRVIELTSSVKK